MKQKKLVYFLGLAVVAVWGVIVYRIVSSIGANDEPAFVEKLQPVKEAYNDYEIKPDTSKLLLNYRDPFSPPGVADTVVKISSIKPVINQTVKPAKAPQNWSFVRYSGYIRNAGSKKLIAMLNINGKSVMLTEGETDSGIKLLKNMKDSIKISFNNQVKFITLNTGSL